MRRKGCELFALFLVCQQVAQAAIVLLREQTFNNGRQGWTFQSRDTRDLYSRGSLTDGALHVRLGGRDNTVQIGMVGGWNRNFRVTEPVNRATVEFQFSISQSDTYNEDEQSGIFVELNDGQGLPVEESIVLGGGTVTGTATVEIGQLSAGTQSIFLGAYNTRKNAIDELTIITFDNIVVLGYDDEDIGNGRNEPSPPPNNRDEPTPPPPSGIPSPVSAEEAVERLTMRQFRDGIEGLANFGDRRDRTLRNNNAARWLESELVSMGYDNVERARVTARRGTRSRFSVYATKEGRNHPEAGMYIVSCHFDGLGNGGAVNDNASGCSLVLAVARALSEASSTEISVRMIFWNAEETGLVGSARYVSDRRDNQGSNAEPQWLGVIQYDQILFDHGPNGGPVQSEDADIDIEYQARATFARLGWELAQRFRQGAQKFAKDYPARVSGNMRNTDSVSFQDEVPSISVRDNTRDEIGDGSNPHWHEPTDVMSSYSDKDFQFGFNIVKMSVGTIWELVEAQ